MDKHHFNELNKQQQEAVSHVRGPSIILAGAGSGKTRVLVHKVLSLIQNHSVNPRSIVMITFTNKAAAEMKERIAKELSGEKQNLGFIGTFHSFCTRILRIEGQAIDISNDFAIYDESDQLSLIKSILKEKGTQKFTPSYFLNRISSAKNALISSANYQKIFTDSQSQDVSMVFKNYQKGLKENKALDFDDLLLKTIELFTTAPEILEKYQNKYPYLLVDEFQDTNLPQYLLTRFLGQSHENVTIVGDFAQAIYSWRGADIKNLEKFEKDFPKANIFHLEKNYRSSQNILDFAFKIISKNNTHPILKLTTDNTGGEEIIFFEADNEQTEAFFVIEEIEKQKEQYDYDSIAILYRTNAQSRIIEEALLHYSIPYVLIGGTRFYARREVKDVLSYLRLLVNYKDSVAQSRIRKLGKKRWSNFEGFVKKENKSLKEKTTEELIDKVFQFTHYLELYNPDNPEDYARLENIRELKSVAIKFPDLTEFLEQVALVESEYFENEKKTRNKQGVKLMTLHQAKGLEFDCVFIVGVEEGILPHSRSQEEYHQLEEERRLFYVGITRARKHLYITHARKRFLFGRRNYAMKSRFLTDDWLEYS